jgi:hypothetical protein
MIDWGKNVSRCPWNRETTRRSIQKDCEKHVRSRSQRVVRRTSQPFISYSIDISFRPEICGQSGLISNIALNPLRYNSPPHCITMLLTTSACRGISLAGERGSYLQYVDYTPARGTVDFTLSRAFWT